MKNKTINHIYAKVGKLVLDGTDIPPEVLTVYRELVKDIESK